MTRPRYLPTFATLGLSSILLLTPATAVLARDGNESPEPHPPKHQGGNNANGAHLIADLAGQGGSGAIDLRSTLREKRLQAGISLDVDGTTLIDSNDAADAEVTLQLPQATCTLAVTDLHFEQNPDLTQTETAEYRVVLGSKTKRQGVSRVKAKIGNCQNTGSANPTDFPTINAGDAVSVFLNGDPTPILTGTFK